MLAEFSTASAHLIDPAYAVGATANWWFMIASTFLLTGAPGNTTTWLAGSTGFAPTPVLGGTLVPVPTSFVVAGSTDASGEWSFPINGGVGVPATLNLQVIVFDPAYDSYEPVVRLQGGRTHHVPMHPPGYRIDWNQVADLVNERTRLIITNTPHNPTGS